MSGTDRYIIISNSGKYYKDNRGLTPGRFAHLSWFMGTFCLLLSSCGGIDQKQAVQLVDSHHLTTSPDTDLNRDIALLANPSFPAPPEPQDYEIGPEDLLEVVLLNLTKDEDGLPRKVQVRVSQTGFIHLALLGNVQATGLTPVRLEQTLREKYEQFMHEPDIEVKVAEYHSHPVSVQGAVGKPGVFQITSPRRLQDLLAMAGGLTREAGTFVHVSRKEAEGVQTYVINLRDLSQDTSGEFNLPIRSGDVVNVPRAGMFFVDGFVRKPGAYPLLREYTLAQALMVAGGTDGDAQLSDITIFRRDATGAVQILKFDLAKIEALEAQNAQIAEDDVIVVPANQAKILISNILGAIGFNLRSSSFGFGMGGRALRGYR